jgi:L-asparaginase II
LIRDVLDFGCGGIDSGMLPMIVTATWPRASFLAKKNSIVKDINSIQFMCDHVLCTTNRNAEQGRIVLNRYTISTAAMISVFWMMVLNCCFLRDEKPD